MAALDDNLAMPTPAVMHGVSCDVCHKVADVNVANINCPGLFPAAATDIRPSDDQVLFGVLADVDFDVPTAMRASYQPQMVAELCGLCHQDKNDPDDSHSFNGVISEPTYLEWLDSPYGDPQSVLYTTCVDCHMPPSIDNEVCGVVIPPPRNVERVRSHRILGTTPNFLENAVEMVVNTEIVGDQLQVQVDLANTLTGHHVPTGVTVRNMILVVDAWLDGHDPLVSPLPELGGQVVHDLGGIGDPAQGYFAGLPGKFFAKVNHDQNGNGPTFFTDATGITFDSRIPALAVDTTTYAFQLPTGNNLVHVRARLIYRRAFRFLVDAKQWTVDGHGNPLEDVQGPDFGHLMEIYSESLQAGVAAPVPALNAWGVGFMTSLLAIGAIAVRRRFRAEPSKDPLP